jgi:hypothetical protein
MLELPESSPVSNRTRKKSKAGCKTCKIRRVKVGRHLDKSCMCHWLITCSAMRRIPFVATVKYITITELRAANMISEPRNTRSQRRPRPKHPLLEIAVFPRITCYLSTFKSLSHKAERYFPKTIGILTLDPFRTQPKSKLPKADRLLHFCMSPFPTIEPILSIQSLH